MKPRKAAHQNSESLENSEPLEKVVQIKPPSFQTGVFHIRGIAPLVVHKFSQKALTTMKDKQEKGSQSRKGTKREAKDFEALYEGAKHISRQGWCGIPASAFRNAMISACRLVGFAMTLAKLSIFIEADGYDKDEGTPLVRITEGEPKRLEMAVRLATGVSDISVRPMWEEWGALLRIRYDADQFSLQDVTNLLMRVGMQVGICEGRPDSKKSAGMGWGIFQIEETK